MAQVCEDPADTTAQPEVTPAGAATGVGSKTLVLLLVPSWPLSP